MAITDIPTQIRVGAIGNKKVANLELIDAKFWGRPNFSGEEDRFKDTRRKFTILIPEDSAEQIRQMGWNVKTTIPSEEDLAIDPERKPLSHLKVMVDDSSEVKLVHGDIVTVIPKENFGIVDRTRFDEVSIEIRAWEYDPDESPGQFSARLVQFVGVFTPSLLQERYGTI